ncbi:transcription initiation factor IIB [Tulasnella sp. 403]|nr:transcription initiation factor IIB [Tulasnella sp. 403]
MDVASVIEKQAAAQAAKYKSVSVEKDIPLQVDPGLLTVVDSNPIDQESYSTDREAHLQALARDGVQVLLAEIFALPSKSSVHGPLALLPKPSTRLPRAKPLPKPKLLTKWQKFANARGIQHRKRDKKVWDESKQEWVNRWGRDGKNKEKEKQWLHVVPSNAVDDYNPAKAAKDQRKERVAKNLLAQQKNLAHNIRAQGEPRKREIERTLAQTRVSTASIGKFDRKLDGEKKPRGVKRKFAPNETTSSERDSSMAMISKLDGRPAPSKKVRIDPRPDPGRTSEVLNSSSKPPPPNILSSTTTSAYHPRSSLGATSGSGTSHTATVTSSSRKPVSSPNMAYAQALPPAPAPPAPPKPFNGPDLAVRLICPDCQDPVPNIREEFGSGDLTFANDEGDDPSRVGAAADPLMDGIEQLDTSISFRDGGSGIARELQRTMAKGAAARAEKTLLHAYREIGAMCDQISLPKTIADMAKSLYKTADQDKVLRGKTLEAAVACCIFIACRQARVPRTFKEICQLTNVPKKTIGQCYKLLESHLNLLKAQNNTTHTPPPLQEGPEALLGRYVNHLDLPVYIERAAVDLVVACREHGVADGRSPISIAGAAIYFVSYLYDKPKTAKEIVTVAGVSESTIKLVYKLMYQQKERLIPKEPLESGRANFTRLPAVSDK